MGLFFEDELDSGNLLANRLCGWDASSKRGHWKL